MTPEQQLASEIFDDRRLVELGLDPNTSTPVLWERLDKMVKEIKLRESNARKKRTSDQAK